MKSTEIGDIFKGDEAGVNRTMRLFKKNILYSHLRIL